MTHHSPSPQALLLILLGVFPIGCAMQHSTWGESGRSTSCELPPAVLPTSYVAQDDGGATAASATNRSEMLRLNVREAVLMALQQNASFRVDRLEPGIMQTYEREARAAFDPVLSGTVSKTDVQDSTNEIAGSDTIGAGVGLRELLPTGTALDMGVDRTAEDASVPAQTSYDVKITQSLLRGRGTGANMARLRQARLDTLSSAYELRGVAEALVAQVERAYWEHVLAKRSIDIYEKSLEIAEQQIIEAKERIRLGNMAETELAAAEAEMASRREKLIDARSALAKSRLVLLRLVNPEAEDPFGNAIELTQAPEVNAMETLDDAKAHVALGKKQRADLNQARLSVARGEIEIVRTRNGVLPKLDLFVRLGGTRYAESFGSQSRDEWSREVQAGISLEYPLGRRAERASHDRAMLSLQQAKGAMVNMRQLVEVDIRTAYLEVDRTQEQVRATEATRKLRDATLQTEVEKLRVGKSTSLLVAQASRDLVESQIGCVRAVVAYREALLDLYRLEGALLERRGIQTGEEAP